MSRTIEVASNAAASAWDDLEGVIAWPGMQMGGMAHNCEIGTGSGCNVDDDAGTIVIPVKRVFRVIEDATASPTVLHKGRVSDKGTGRGTMWTDDAKQFDVSLDDNNAQLRGIVVDGWSRPAETDVARVHAVAAAFLDGSPRASTVIDDTTYVPNSNTIMLDAHKYTDTDPAGVIQDCADSAGKQCFVTENDELFYDLDTSVAYAAALAITDDNPNLTDEFAPIEPHGHEEGNEFWSGATLKYGTGSASVSDVRSAAEAAHDYWRTIYNDPDATASTAAARLGTMLDNQSIEEYTATCSLQLNADQVDLIKYGQTVSFRSAAADQLDPIILRIASLYWEPIGIDVYVCHLELGVPQKMRPRVARPQPKPEDITNAEITVDNGGLTPCGSDISLTMYQKVDGSSSGIGTWGIETGDMSIFTALMINDAWPGTPCGLSLGAWREWGRQYGALVGTAPADAGCVMARLSFGDAYPGDHGNDGFLSGSSPSTHGPVLIYGGMAGTPLDADVSGAEHGSISGGMVVGQVTAEASAAYDVDIPRSAIAWGGDFRLVFAPGWYLQRTWICVEEDISGGNATNCGTVKFHGWGLQPYGIASGAYGWLTAAPQGDQDGVNTTYTILGGYNRVETLWRNGVALPSTAFRATDGGTLTTLGWAPLPTDTILARYFVPR